MLDHLLRRAVQAGLRYIMSLLVTNGTYSIIGIETGLLHQVTKKG